MSNITISIANDFSKYPGGRYRSDGRYSGQEFFEDKLQPILDKNWDKKNLKILIDFDGTFGYASSFISEICVRLVKEYKDKSKIINKIDLKSDDEPLLITAIHNFIEKADE